MAKKSFGTREPVKLPSEYGDVTMMSVAGGMNRFFAEEQEGKDFEQGFSTVLGVIIGNATASKFADLKSTTGVDKTIFSKNFAERMIDSVQAIKDVLVSEINPVIYSMALGFASMLGLLEKIENNSSSGKIDVVLSISNVKDFEKIETFLSAVKGDDEMKKRIVALKDNLKLLQDFFDNDIEPLYKSAKAKEDKIKFIKEQSDKAVDIATSMSKVDIADIEASRYNSAKIIDAIAALGLVMIIGGLIISRNEKLIAASLKFGATLALFLMELMVPVLLLSVINRYFSSFNSLDSVMTFILASTAVMMIGAAFTLIPKLGVAALKFGFILTRFLTTILLPLALISLIARGSVFKAMAGVTQFVVTATAIMILGGLIFRLGAGKYVADALKFGAVLSLFIAEIIAPFAIFGLLVKKSFAVADNFHKLVITSTVLMTLGALFFTLGGGAYVKYALMFGAVLGAFIFTILTPIILYSAIALKAHKTLAWLTGFMITSTVIMLFGANFMKSGAWKLALAFASLLMVFTTMVLLPVTIFGVMMRKADSLLKNFTLFILAETALMLIGATIILTRPEYIAGVLIFGATLSLFMTLTILPLLLFEKPLRKAAGALIIFGAFIMMCGATLALGAAVIQKNWFGAILFTIIMPLFLFGMYEIADYMGDKRKQDKVRRGIVTGLMIAGLVTALGLSVALVNILFPGWTILEATGKVVALGLIVGGFSLLLRTIGKIPKQALIYGSLVAGGMSIIIGSLAIALMLLKKVNITPDLMLEALMLDGIVGIFATILGIIGIPFVAGLVGLGEAVVLGISIIIGSISKSISKMHKTFTEIGSADVAIKEAMAIGKIVSAYSLILAGLSPLIIPAQLGRIAANAIAGAIKPLAKSISRVSKAAKLAQDVKNPKIIGSIITDFMKAIPVINPMSFMKTKASVKMIKGIVKPMTRTMGRIARAVGEISSLKIATEWNSKGKPIEYRHLRQKDFEQAVENIKNLILTMTDGIMLAAADYATIDKKTLKKTLYASKELGKVIGNIATGMQSYANLVMPTEWNEEGKPIAFRKITDKDFENASLNIRKVILLLGGTIAQLAVGNGEPIKIGDITVNPKDFTDALEDIPAKGLRGIIGKTNPSKFVRMLTASTQLGELISGIASGIQAFASMNMPTAWDDRGNPTAFKKLDDAEIESASRNVSRILTALAGSIINTYNSKDAIIDNQNIFDSSVVSTGFLGLNKTETPSKFERTLGASMRLGELISNIAAGVQSIADLKLPVEWNDRGKPIRFESIDLDSISQKLPDIIGKILLTTTQGVISAHKEYQKIMSPEEFERVTTAFTPVGNLIKDIAKSLKYYTELKIPIYDKDGKITGYEQLPDDYSTAVTSNVKDIICTLSKALVSAYNAMKLSPEMLDLVLNSFTPVAKIVKDTADAIVSYAAGKMIDPVTGKETMINAKLIESASKNIENIITCIVSTLVDTYNKHSEYFGEQDTIGSIYSISGHLVKAAELVKTTVGAIKEFAGIDPGLINSAGDNIKLIVTKIPEAIINGLEGYKDKLTEDVIESSITLMSGINRFLKELQHTQFKYDPEIYANIEEAMVSVSSMMKAVRTSFDNDMNIIIEGGGSYIEQMERNMKSFSSIVREMIEASSMRIEDNTVFDTIADGIMKINDKASNIDGTKIRNLDSETKSLSKFIKEVNKTDVSKVSKLTSLMDSMSRLADKMGGFDKLAEVINSDLKGVVEKLSEKITDAKETIKRAERIEEERQKKFNNNISELRRVMSESITVNVGRLAEDDTIKAGYERVKK